MGGEPLTAGSMCTGYGGLDQAVDQVLGTRQSWVADPGPGPSRILAWRYPAAPNLGDIRHVNWGVISPVDVLCAGWPCEPVSQAGQQKGVTDARWLWPAVAAAVSGLHPRPRLLVFENVLGLLSINAGAAFTEVVCSLAAMGYVGRYGVFRASDAGAPHQRKRVFIAAVAPDARDWAVTEWARRAGRPAGQRPPVGGVADERGPGPAADPAGIRLRGSEIGGEDRGVPAETERPGQLGRVPEPAGGRGERAAGVQWGRYAPAITRWEAVTGRTAPRPFEPGKGGAQVLSPPFSEWMMGLPAGWVTGVPGLARDTQLEAIGRGVVPQSAVQALEHLLGGLLT
jgi:DNA (cytosine-5)-methyltransferase 1